VAFASWNVTVTGLRNTRPSGSNLRMGPSAVMPVGAVAPVVDTVIIVVDETAPAGTFNVAALFGSVTVPPAAGVMAELAVWGVVVLPAPPQPARPSAAATAASLKRLMMGDRETVAEVSARVMSPRGRRGKKSRLHRRDHGRS